MRTSPASNYVSYNVNTKNVNIKSHTIVEAVFTQRFRFNLNLFIVFHGSQLKKLIK